MDKPIEVAASATGTQVATGSRDLLLIVAALPALVTILGTRDVKTIVDWFASEPGIAFLGLVIALATPVYRQWKARREHEKLKTLEPYAPQSVATLKGTRP